LAPWKSALKSLFTNLMAALTRSRTRRPAGKPPRRLRLQVEALEERQLLSAAPLAPEALVTFPENPSAGNLNYVTGVYQDVLGRAPDPTGLAAWTGQLELGMPRSQFASAITHSAEFYTNRVMAAYQKYLGRAPDAAALAGWVKAMQQGLSDERLEAGLIGSAEYLAKHGGPGAGWVKALYQDVLGCAPTAAELDGWVQALKTGLSPTAAAYGFTASAEHEGLVVTADYQKYLGRAPEPGAVPVWVNAFAHGFSNEDLVAGFVGSDEYFQDHSKVVPTNQVTLRGTLRTGVMAIGGETTGTVIDTDQGSFELDLGKDPILLDHAKQLNGRAAIVQGTLKIQLGVEVPVREIITVTGLEADPLGGGEGPGTRNTRRHQLGCLLGG
jgi:hypothetical protein